MLGTCSLFDVLLGMTSFNNFTERLLDGVSGWARSAHGWQGQLEYNDHNGRPGTRLRLSYGLVLGTF